MCASSLINFLFISQVVDHKLYGSRSEFDSTIDRVLEEFGVEVVCLAGFMRILTGTFVKKWNGKTGHDHLPLMPTHKHRELIPI